MRAYFFGNMYLSSIQQGIQAAHCLAEMFMKYPPNSCPEANYLYDWAQNHKTMILLNGGYSSNLAYVNGLFRDLRNIYPHSFFRESVEALENTLTCVGIILPEVIYNNVDLVVAHTKTTNTSEYAMLTQEIQKANISNYEMMLCLELSKYGLAR